MVRNNEIQFRLTNEVLAVVGDDTRLLSIAQKLACTQWSCYNRQRVGDILVIDEENVQLCIVPHLLHFFCATCGVYIIPDNAPEAANDRTRFTSRLRQHTGGQHTHLHGSVGAAFFDGVAKILAICRSAVLSDEEILSQHIDWETLDDKIEIKNGYALPTDPPAVVYTEHAMRELMKGERADVIGTNYQLACYKAPYGHAGDHEIVRVDVPLGDVPLPEIELPGGRIHVDEHNQIRCSQCHVLIPVKVAPYQSHIRRHMKRYHRASKTAETGALINTIDTEVRRRRIHERRRIEAMYGD